MGPVERRRNASRKKQQDSETNSLKNYVKLVLIVSFAIGTAVAIVTGNGEIAFGSMILGLFFGFLIYTGMYN